MSDSSEINKLIIETVETCCDKKTVRSLIEEALQYELDIWNRHILPSTIKDEYDRMVERVIKEDKT